MLTISVALAAATCWGQTLSVSVATKAVLQRRLESGVVKLKERQPKIRELFADAGCEAEEQRVDKKFGNVICTLPGETDSTIIVGGHYDFIEAGAGIVDDWSGSAMLPSLYQALKDKPRKYTYVFVAFAAEERGLVGSTEYVKRLSREKRAAIRAFVNIECVGLGSTQVWVSRSTPDLVSRLAETAQMTGAKLGRMDVDQVGDDDTHPFLNLKIPVLSIHSITPETLPVLHSNQDRVEAIQMTEYFQTYRLMAFYLAYLDLKLQ